MRIGFDAKRLYNNFTGLGNYSRTLVGNLLSGYPHEEIFLYTPKRRLPPLEGAVTRMPSKRSLTWRSWGVKKMLRADGIELYHGLSHDLPFGIHRMGVRSIVTIHDVCYRTFPEMFPLIERVIYGIKYRYACRHSDRIIAISESTKADIVKYLGVSPSKIEVIYQSINPIFYSPQSDPRLRLEGMDLPERYLLYVGSINSRKNLLGIVRAYELLPTECRLPLLVVGNGTSYKESVLKYAADHDLMRYLVMLDSVNDPMVLQALYQCAEVFIYPSFYEGFGLPVTEALLSGTPVITSSVSSLPEAGGDAALYVDPTSAEEIAEAVIRLLSDKQLRDVVITKGINYANDMFAPDKLTRQVHDLYERVVKGA